MYIQSDELPFIQGMGAPASSNKYSSLKTINQPIQLNVPTSGSSPVLAAQQATQARNEASASRARATGTTWNPRGAAVAPRETSGSTSAATIGGSGVTQNFIPLNPSVSQNAMPGLTAAYDAMQRMRSEQEAKAKAQREEKIRRAEAEERRREQPPQSAPTLQVKQPIAPPVAIEPQAPPLTQTQSEPQSRPQPTPPAAPPVTVIVEGGGGGGGGGGGQETFEATTLEEVEEKGFEWGKYFPWLLLGVVTVGGYVYYNRKKTK